MKVYDITTGEQTWITPPSIHNVLGHFDLDPCAADEMPYRTADRMVTKKEDGLSFDWGDCRVWLNPPFGNSSIPFLERMHNGIALLPSRTDNRWFHELVLPKAYGIWFVRGRIKYLKKDLSGEGRYPAFASMLVAYTKYDYDVINNSGIKGHGLLCLKS